MLQVQSRRDPLRKKTPHPHCAPLALSPCLLNCGEMRPAATAKARAERSVSARRRCGARRSGRETRSPGQRAGRRLGGQRPSASALARGPVAPSW